LDVTLERVQHPRGMVCICKQRKREPAEESRATEVARTGYNSAAYEGGDHRTGMRSGSVVAAACGSRSLSERAVADALVPGDRSVPTSETRARDADRGAIAGRGPVGVDAREDAGSAVASITPLEELPGTHVLVDEDLAHEAALVLRLRAGDAGAFEELVRDVGPRLYAVAKRFLANDDDAREAMQDAMLSAYRSLDRFDERSRLSTWLHRIVVNASLMKLRTKRRKPSVSLEGLGAAAGASGGGEEATSFAASVPSDAHGARTGRELRGTTPTLEETDVRELLRAQMELLPDEYRTVLLLRDVEELDTLQTARVLGVSESAVKTRLHRARLALREAMLRATGKGDALASGEHHDGGAA
jgi:RNA polymerase sigma-70 factor, ECF subfamily